MTILIQRMREELVRRNYAATTIHSYLKAVEHFRSHVDTPIDEVGPDDLRSYHAYLLGTRKLAVNTVVLNICALRFLYMIDRLRTPLSDSTVRARMKSAA